MPPLRRLRCVWPGGISIDVQVREEQLAPTGPTFSPTPIVVEAEPAQVPTGVTPPLAWEEDPAGFFEPLRLREDTDYFLELQLPGPKALAAKRMEVCRSGGQPWPFRNAHVNNVVKLLPAKTWQDIVDGSRPMTRLFATANFGSFVGVVDLSLDAGGALRAEVASRKIEYFHDFKTLLTEVAEETVDLLLQVGSVANLRFATSGADQARPAVILFHVRRLMDADRLPAAVEDIVAEPHSQLVVEDELRQPAVASSVDLTGLAARGAQLPFIKGGPLAGLFHGWTPELLPVRFKRDSVDTPENRYVLDFLEGFAVLLRDLHRRVEAAANVSAAREVGRWVDAVEEWLAAPIWRDVGPLHGFPGNSQVLIRRSSYREVLQADLTLRDGLALPWERMEEMADTLGEIRPIFELYEYWCFFALRAGLRHLCGPEQPIVGDFYVERNHGLALDIRRGKPSRLRFKYTGGNTVVAVDLFYNRLFRRPTSGTYANASYSTSFQPDYSLHLTRTGVNHWLHFDAKYRLDLAEWEKELAESDVSVLEDELTEGQTSAEDHALYKKADLYKVHAYRDALLGSRGAYVLFPAAGGKTVFVRHSDAVYRAANEIPSVGAFPLRPGSAAQQVTTLTDFLRRVLDAVADSGRSYEGEAGFVTG
jgi:predicted component of viral defense system (DUF524 family)